MRIVGIACAPAPLRVPFCMIATRGCTRVHQRRRTRRVESRGAETKYEIDRADRIVRAHQVEFFVPQQIAEIDRAELAERDHAADRLGVLRIGR